MLPSLDDIKIINLPKILDSRGNLSFYEGNVHIPFDIKRTYWIYDVPGGECRGGHAFKNQQEFIIAISGSFDVIIQDGNSEKRIQLNRSYYGVYIPKMMWRSLENFSTNSLALLVSDTSYNASDYIRDLGEFKSLRDG